MFFFLGFRQLPSRIVSQPTFWQEGEAKRKYASSHEENAWSLHQRLFEKKL